MSITICVQHPWHYRNWEPVLKHFDDDEATIHVSPWRAHLPKDPAVHRAHLQSTLSWLEERGVTATHGPWSVEPHVFATLAIEPRMVGQKWSKQVRMLYAVISKQYTYSQLNRHYDSVLVASEFGASLLARHGVRTQVVGYPKLDPWFDGSLTRASARAALGIPDDRTLIVYAPTLEPMCAHETFADALRELDLDAEMIVQLHPVSYLAEGCRFEHSLPEARVMPPEEAGIHVVAAADALITDYSGVTFEACAMDVPVLLLEKPGVEPTEDVERRYRDAGPRVFDPSELRPRLEELLASPHRWAERRAFYRDEFFAHHGDAGRRAAEAFRQLAAEAFFFNDTATTEIYTRMRQLEIAMAR